MVLREALAGVPRDSYFLSVKFGVLPQPGGGIYGLDVKPWNVKAHLAYSLHRLGLDYVDLYQPARMDESIPVEEIIGAIQECVDAGYVRNIGLTQLAPENLERVFKEFEQIENPMTKKQSGTGLGLPIVKKLTELHHGTISLQSELGKGTEAILLLPLEQEGYINRPGVAVVKAG
jgi:hypothetical protein